MNLVKWFRKNRSKVMAITVVVLMIGFVGGSALTYILSPERTMGSRAVAYYGRKTKIANGDLISARHELEILQMLQMDELLRSQDLQAFLLGELLFSNGRAAPAVVNYLMRTIRENQFPITDEQIANLYKAGTRGAPPYICWFLLNAEAERAGIRRSNDEAGQILARLIPQLFQGSTYAQLMNVLMRRQGVSEEQILATVAKLLAVLQYAHETCCLEDVTDSQLRHLVSWENEMLNAELVRFDSSFFSRLKDANLPDAGEEKMLEQFDKYKRYFSGDISDDNPYGFGYKLPDLVQLEYIVVKLNDISSIVTNPTREETEQYYQKHTDIFTSKVPSDPNDPNSPQITQVKSYAESVQAISRQLKQERIRSKAESILYEARSLTELNTGASGSQNAQTLNNKSTSDRSQKAGDYKTVAEQLSKKHNIAVYAGKTGLLSRSEVQASEYLGRLYVSSPSERQAPIPLSQIVFLVDPLRASPLELMSMQKPELYEDIGPLRDVAEAIMAIVRVVEVRRASEPQGIDQCLSKKTIEIDPNQPAEQNYSVREKVAHDLKNLAAMDTADSKAQEFIDLVRKNGWENALDTFNRQYPAVFGTGKDENEPNTFKLETLTEVHRIPKRTLQVLALQSSNDPDEQFFIKEVQNYLTFNQARTESQFIDKLYSLVPVDSNSVDNIPVCIGFEPYMSFYVIKSISVNRVTQQEYDNLKAVRAYGQDQIQRQNLATVHFDPENITKRLNFRWASPAEKEEPGDVNASAESEEPV